MALLPKDTLANPEIPNSCQTCHQHKDEDLADLQRRYDALTARGPTAAAVPAAAPAPAPTTMPSGG